MCYCDAEYPDFLTITNPKAVKLHWCCECGVAIRKGDSYQRSSGKWAGDIQTYVRCMHCADLVRLMHWWNRQIEGCYCEVYSQLMETVQEEWREGKSRLIGRAYIAMQRRWYRHHSERKAFYNKKREEYQMKTQGVSR